MFREFAWLSETQQASRVCVYLPLHAQCFSTSPCHPPGAPATHGPPKRAIPAWPQSYCHTPTSSWMQDGWLGGAHQKLLFGSELLKKLHWWAFPFRTINIYNRHFAVNQFLSGNKSCSGLLTILVLCWVAFLAAASKCYLLISRWIVAPGCDQNEFWKWNNLRFTSKPNYFRILKSEDEIVDCGWWS